MNIPCNCSNPSCGYCFGNNDGATSMNCADRAWANARGVDGDAFIMAVGGGGYKNSNAVDRSRLIACAPELLESLKLASQFVAKLSAERDNGTGLGFQAYKAMRIIEKTLDKVDGK